MLSRGFPRVIGVVAARGVVSRDVRGAGVGDVRLGVMVRASSSVRCVVVVGAMPPKTLSDIGVRREGVT